MKCPLVKEFDGNPVECGSGDCGWWDSRGEQCSIVTIAMELRTIRESLFQFPR